MNWDTARADAIKQRMAEQSAINRQNHFGFKNAPAQQPRFGGGQQYAGGDPNFDERTGMPYARPSDYSQGQAQYYAGQRPNPGDSYLAMLLKKYGGAAQGFGQELGGWLKNRVPNANRQYMDARHQFINNRVDGL